MSNHLISETSPYLLQHAQNPVDWYPWGEEALQKAKEEDKLILVSIGYAACHWCHVMEHECFEDEEVAAIMNANFVCIKVDREERPDIDKTYMDAIIMMTGRGGWPLNCFALPDGRPISGGTYFPKANWMEVMKQLSDVYKDNRDKALEYASNLTDAIKNMGELAPVSTNAPFTVADIQQLLSPWMEQVDFEFGGRKSSSNKFPLPLNNLFLLRAGWLLSEKIASEGFDATQVQQAATTTLGKMAFGGIYDQLGGGFSRYSVDPYWKVPHFEKMLYDNSQLVSVYAEAWQATSPDDIVTRDLYKQVVYDTLAYIEREMTSPEGGFYASLDADSEGEEGKFYTWTYPELETALGENLQPFADYYNAHPNGNWEHTNVLFVLESEDAFAKQSGIDPEAFKEKMAANRKALFTLRESKIRPALDDKILTSWNALMLKGYCDAYRTFREPSFLEAAKRNAAFISTQLADGGKLYRNYKAGKRTINGFLDDYAFLIDAYISLYQVTFDETWIEKAVAHLDHVKEHFADSETGMYFYTSDEDAPLVKRHIEVQDDVIPASNSVLAHSFFTLGLILHREDFTEQAQGMLQTMKATVLENPAWHSNWALLLLRHAFPHFEVAITGLGPLATRLQFEPHYYPNRIFAGSDQPSTLPILVGRQSDETTIYVCEGKSCRMPVVTVEEAMEEIG